MDSQQRIQEQEYNFPYHYVSQYEPWFTQFYNDTWGINYVATIEFLIEFLKEEEFDSLVDIGCGDGRIAMELSITFKGKRISGFDYSSKALDICNALNPNRGSFFRFDILQDNLKDKFDIGILIEVFEHIPVEKCEQFVEAISKKVLKEKGTLLLTVPHINKTLETKHYQHFDSSKIQKYFDPYFDIIQIIPFEKRGYEKKIIDIILTNRFFILNHIGLRKKIYKYYKDKLFYTKESRCNRLFVKLVKK